MDTKFIYLLMPVYRNTIATLNYDIFQVCNYLPMLAVSILKPKLNMPIVFSIYNTPSPSGRTIGYYENTKLDQLLAQFILASSAYDRLVLNSQAYLQSVLSLNSKLKNTITFFPLATDMIYTKNILSSSALVAKKLKPYISTINKRPLIILLGRITSHKDIEDAVNALDILNKKKSVADLVLTGMALPFDSEYAKKILKKVHELNLDKNAIIPNKQIPRKLLPLHIMRVLG